MGEFKRTRQKTESEKPTELVQYIQQYHRHERGLANTKDCEDTPYNDDNNNKMLRDIF